MRRIWRDILTLRLKAKFHSGAGNFERIARDGDKSAALDRVIVKYFLPVQNYACWKMIGIVRIFKD